MVLSYYRDTVALPRFTGIFNTIIAELLRLPLIPVITTGFQFPSRPIPRFLDTDQVYREFADVFHYRPDHHRSVSLPNKFNVELPTFSFAVPTITQVLVQSKCTVIPIYTHEATNRLVAV